MKVFRKTWMLVFAFLSITCLQAQDDFMARMQAHQPGPQHKLLEQFVGKWDISIKWTLAPGKPPFEAKATSEQDMIFGGRFLHAKVKFSLPGFPENFELIGYDNLKKEYFSTTFMSIETAPMTMLGSLDAAGKVFSWKYEYPSISGRTIHGRQTTRFENPDRYTAEAYETGNDGKEYKAFEGVWTRATDKKATSAKE